MISKLIAYETGELDNDEIIALFQHLLDTGIIYVLQGHYQRVAQGFLDEGLITRSPAKKVRRRAAKRGPKALAAKIYKEAQAALMRTADAESKRVLSAEDEAHFDAMEDAFGPHGQG